MKTRVHIISSVATRNFKDPATESTNTYLYGSGDMYSDKHIHSSIHFKKIEQMN